MAPETPLSELFRLGTVHMLGGFDHLLFVLGIVILFAQAGNVLKAVTLFTLGHSTTLIAATALGLKLDPALIDAVIGLSVAYVAWEIAVSRETGPNVRRTRIAVFIFGLIHGLGLSTRLQDLGLPSDGLLWRVASFNVGVEVGQVVALGLFLGVVLALRRGGWIERLRGPVSTGLAYTGAGICLYSVMMATTASSV